MSIRDPAISQSADQTPKPAQSGSDGSPRRQQIISVATHLFNVQGFGATNLEDVARVLELGRTAVYHYFKSKDELTFACFAETCARRIEYLEVAARSRVTAAEQIARFLALEFDKHQGPIADLAEVTELGSPYREEIEDLMAHAIALLVRIVDDGIDSGTIRHCHSEILAQTLIGICHEWAVPERLGFGNDFDSTSAATKISDYLCRGLLPEALRQQLIEPPPLEYIDGFPQIEFEETDKYLIRRDQILAKALALVNKRGFAGSTLDDIGEELGVTKGSIYHYAETKEQLLFQSYDRAIRLLERCEGGATATGHSASDISRRSVHYCIRAHDTPMGPLPVYNAMHSLEARNRDFLNMRRRELMSSARKRMATSIAQGLMEPCDTGLVQTIINAMIHGLPRWYDKHIHGSLLHVEREISLILALGITER